MGDDDDAGSSTGVIVVVAIAVLALIGLVIWSVSVNQDELEIESLCRQYVYVTAAGDEIKAMHPEGATAGEATDVARAYLANVRQLGAVADGRYGQYILALETAVADVARTLDSLPDAADYSTWQPLVDDSVEDAVTAAAQLKDRVGPACVDAAAE